MSRVLQIIIIVLLVAAIAVGLGIWYKGSLQNHPEGVACTQDAKECPDGSYVGRTGPNCEFAACPPGINATTSIKVAP